MLRPHLLYVKLLLPAFQVSLSNFVFFFFILNKLQMEEQILPKLN